MDDAGTAGLRAALELLSRYPQVTMTPLPRAVADVVPDNWRVVGHHVQLVAEVVVLRDTGSGLWGILVLPIPLRGGRPSTWQAVAPAPIPYDNLDPEHRARLLAEAADVRVGSLLDIACSYLDPVDQYYRDEDLFEERRVPTGYRAVLATLLAVAPSDERSTLEARLHRSGIECPVVVRLRDMPR
jgi:hypothetical protein